MGGKRHQWQRRLLLGEERAKKLKAAMKISDDLLLQSGTAPLTPDGVRAAYGPCQTLGFRGCPEVKAAQDAALDSAGVYSLLHHTLASGYYQSIPQFLGYGVLSNLTQDGLIRAGVEMRADEMTRKWVELTYGGQDQAGLVPDDNLSTLAGDLERFRMRELFRAAAAMSGYFGGCLAYIDVGDLSDDDLKTPLLLDHDTFSVGSLRGFRLVEPFNVAPGRYDTSSPISSSYFVPQTWFVLGTEIHRSRFLYFSEGQPPTLLLPSYNFFGIPLAQTVLDVVTHFTACREAEARLLTKFSLTVLKTDMAATLAGGAGGEIEKRIRYFVQNRDNDGVMTIDNATEDIVKLETPLSGVTDIVRQAMEMVAAMFGEPVVKLWGISPGGFNATGESDMQSHYDHIHSVQEKLFRKPFKRALEILQLNSLGDIDDALTFNFVPLSVEDDRAAADTQKVKADTAVTLFDRGIVSGEEVRKALSEDPKSQFTQIDPDQEIEPPDLALEMEAPQPEGEGEERENPRPNI